MAHPQLVLTDLCHSAYVLGHPRRGQWRVPPCLVAEQCSAGCGRVCRIRSPVAGHLGCLHVLATVITPFQCKDCKCPSTPSIAKKTAALEAAGGHAGEKPSMCSVAQLHSSFAAQEPKIVFVSAQTCSEQRAHSQLSCSHCYARSSESRLRPPSAPLPGVAQKAASGRANSERPQGDVSEGRYRFTGAFCGVVKSSVPSG